MVWKVWEDLLSWTVVFLSSNFWKIQQSYGTLESLPLFVVTPLTYQRIVTPLWKTQNHSWGDFLIFTSWEPPFNILEWQQRSVFHRQQHEVKQRGLDNYRSKRTSYPYPTISPALSPNLWNALSNGSTFNWRNLIFGSFFAPKAQNWAQNSRFEDFSGLLKNFEFDFRILHEKFHQNWRNLIFGSFIIIIIINLFSVGKK